MNSETHNPETNLQILRNTPLFAESPAPALNTLAAGSSLHHYATNSTLFRAGDIPSHLYVLSTGGIQLIISTSDERETVLELIQPQETFVIAPALTAQPYLMSAFTVEASTLLQIPIGLLLTELHKTPTLSLALLASMAQQYRYLVREIKGLRLRTASQRLALYLLHLSEKEPAGSTLHLPYEKKLLAARLGMTPESFSRAIVELRHHGAEVQGNVIHITQLDKLHRFCRLDQVLDTLEKGLRIMLPSDSES